MSVYAYVVVIKFVTFVQHWHVVVFLKFLPFAKNLYRTILETIALIC